MVTRAPAPLGERKLNLIAAVVGVVADRVAVVVVLIATSGGPSGQGQRNTAADQVADSESPFACSSVWNAPLAAQRAAVTAFRAVFRLNSARIHQGGRRLDQQLQLQRSCVHGPARPGRLPVTLDTSGAGSADELARAFKQGVPIPPGAKAAAGQDQHMVVWQPSTNTMWEFWHAQHVNGAWHARWGGKMTMSHPIPGTSRTRPTGAPRRRACR